MQPQRRSKVQTIPEVVTEADRQALEIVRGLMRHMIAENEIHQAAGHTEGCPWVSQAIGQSVATVEDFCDMLIDAYDEVEEGKTSRAQRIRERRNGPQRLDA